MNISRTKQLFILATILLLAALAAYGALFVFIQNANQDISALESSIGVRGKQEMNLRSIQTIAEDTLEERTQLDSYFVSPDAVVDFIETIEQLAIPTGTSIETTAVEEHSELESAEAHSFLRMQFTVRGSWQEIFHLLALIETLPFYIEVEKANLERELVDGVERWRGAIAIETAVTKK